MSHQSVYKEVLLDHFHNPRNKGDLDGMDAIQRGSNPRCGDDIEIGVKYRHGVIEAVRFRGRGCSICLASASIMSEAGSGLNLQQACRLSEKVRLWFDGENTETPSNITIAALGAVRKHPARKKCVLLAWNALDEILSGLGKQTGQVG